MRCPECNATERQAVKETRKGSDGEVVRKRRCDECRCYYATVERVDLGTVPVAKSDGRIVPFTRESLFRSISEATAGGHTPDQIEDVIDGVVADLHLSREQAAIASSRIGELVEQHLKKLSVVSHIRFALAFVGRRNRMPGDPRAGWQDARDVRQWLSSEYPQLEDYRPAGRLTDVVKVRTGVRVRFNRNELKRTTAIVCTGRGSEVEVDRLASDVANDVEEALGDQPIVTTGQISAEVLRSLRRRDDIAYLRYASVIKQFASALDYEAEAFGLANERRRDNHSR